MNIIKKFFAALWGIFKKNVKEHKDEIHEQLKKDLISAAVEARK